MSTYTTQPKQTPSPPGKAAPESRQETATIPTGLFQHPLTDSLTQPGAN
jgi:hypothetical protein